MKKENEEVISLRDYFAGKAMQALIESDWIIKNSGRNLEPLASDLLISQWAYEYADAMIIKRKK